MSLNLLTMLFLMQPRILVAFFDKMSHCWLMVSLLHISTCSANLLFSQSVPIMYPIMYWCMVWSQQSSSHQLLDYLYQEVTINALWKPPGLLVP